MTTAPVGAAPMASPWLIQTVSAAGVGEQDEPASVRVSGVRPYSPPPVRAHEAAAVQATSWAP